MASSSKVYAAWVRRIEIGLSTWSDDSTEIETPMLARFPLRTKSKFKKKRDREILISPGGALTITNSLVLVQHRSIKSILRVSCEQSRHFCSACFKADKAKLEHPQSSSACPYYKK